MLLLPWFISIGKNDLTGGSIVRASLCLVSRHVSSLLPIVLCVIIGEVWCFSSHWGDLIWQRMNHQATTKDSVLYTSVFCLHDVSSVKFMFFCHSEHIYHMPLSKAKLINSKHGCGCDSQERTQSLLSVSDLTRVPRSLLTSNLCWPDRGYHAVMGQHDLFSFIGSGAGHLWSSEKHPPDTGQGCFVMTLTNVAMIHGVTGSSCQKYQHNSL